MAQEDRTTGLVGYSGVKIPVRAATTANITLSGLQTIDGVALAQDDRVLVKNQTTGANNGIYLADSGDWNRAPDCDGPYDIVKGSLVLITDGSTLAGQTWKVSTDNPITIGTTSLAFVQALISAGSSVSFLQYGTGAIQRDTQSKGRESVSVQDFGAVGDGVTDNKAAFNAAIVAANALGGADVVVPGALAKYIVASTVSLLPYVRIVLKGATIRFTGAATSLFQYVGVTEAASLNGAIVGTGTLESSSSGSGYAVRLRNFANFLVGDGVIITGFNRAVKADWGLGLTVRDGCTMTTNTAGVEVGGDDTLPAGIAAGIRGGTFATSPFMDSVSITNCGFSQNQIDINDMGSQNSLGGLIVEGNTFYENAAVASKTQMIRVTARNGFSIRGNWFEEFNTRKIVVINNFDYAGANRGVPTGGVIEANTFRSQGGAGAEGVHVDRSDALRISNNDFWWGNSAGGYGINLQDVTSPVVVGNNKYNTYSGGSFTANVLQAKDFSLFLDADQIQRALTAITTSNFVTLPNGLILQYGSVDFSSSAVATWTFAKAFPTRVLWAHCSPVWGGTNNYATLNTDVFFATVTASVDFRTSTGASAGVVGVCVAIGY